MATIRSLLILLTLLPPAAAQTTLSYLDVGQGAACCMAVDAAGNTYTAGNLVQGIVVAKFDRDLKPVYRFAFGGGPTSTAALAIAVDAQGSVFVAGYTTAPDFPLVQPLNRTVTRNGTGFLSKVAPAGDRLLFSTFLGGVSATSVTTVNALATDSKGDVYLAGNTTASDFPVTANAYQKTGPPSGVDDTYLAYVTKISGVGNLILYSTFLGDRTGSCPVVGPCIAGYSSAKAIAVTSDSAITVAGTTVAPHFPVTAGAVQTICRCDSRNRSSGFVTRFTPDGASLQWSTFLGGTGNPNPNGNGGDQLLRLALAPNGDAVVAGFAVSPDFPVTAGAFQTKLVGIDPSKNSNAENAVLARIDSTGKRLIFSTYFGGSSFTFPAALRLDAAGNAWVSGLEPALNFAVLPGSLRLGEDFLSEFAADGTKLLLSHRLPSTGAGFALDSAGAPTVFGSTGALLRLPAGATPTVLAYGLSNSAGYTNAKVVPGELVSFYGLGLGPAIGAGAQFDTNGRIATRLAGTQVLFDGVAAPLLYAGDGQVNAIVPFGVSGQAYTNIEVRPAGGTSSLVVSPVAATDPRIFSDSNGRALAINEDGTLNSLANPAARGSIVTFWVSGAGFFPSLADGAVVQPPLPVPVLPVSVMFDSVLPGEVLYAGAAPGLVAGVLQVNVRVPVTKFPPNIVEVSVGGVKGGAGIATK